MADQITALLYKSLSGSLTIEEQQVLAEWEAMSAINRQLADEFRDRERVRNVLSDLERMKGLTDARLRASGVPIRNTAVRAMLLRWSAAAAVLLLAAVGIYLGSRPEQAPPTTAAAIVKDVQPGKNGAILTLSDGSQLVLDSIGNGVIDSSNGVMAVLNNGQLSYRHAGASPEKTAYNTITTPKGRQFRLTLPDGTKVWLNAASMLRYPTAFTGTQRKVEVEGEAFFEVAQDARKPFMLRVNNREDIAVLGTEFNVRAYDRPIYATLLQGSIRVMNVVLRPGQQAQVDDDIKIINKVNLIKVTAWKNGRFYFEDAGLEEVMQELERWYDIEVVYADGIPKIQFYGEINRQNTLQEVLHILEKNEVRFRLEDGRKLVVLQ